MSWTEKRKVVSVLGQEISCVFDDALGDTVDILKRTEDCRFSPDGSRLVIAGFAESAIFVFDFMAGTELRITGVHQVTTGTLSAPHGIDFITASEIAIANRTGNIDIIRLPDAKPGRHVVQVTPLASLSRASAWHKIKSPGSVAVSADNPDGYHIYACNNYADCISRHDLKIGPANQHRSVRNRIVARDYLSTPDGIALSPDRKIAAISNHDENEILLFDVGDKFTLRGRLAGTDYPHGLRFTADGQYLIVADAGQPFIHVYAMQDDWSGDINPIRSVRVMDDKTYLRGRVNPAEGGLKGVDIHPTLGLLAVTCEFLPLTFFSLSDILTS